MYAPDYDGGSIVNLLSSIIRSRGGYSPHRGLSGLTVKSLSDARKVIYLVVDGVGESQLQRFLREDHGKRFFAAHERRVISTVFPATTAAAVTTFGSGASPAEHAVLGWFLHLHDLGLVSTILPAITRTGSPLAPADFDLGAYLKIPSYISSTGGRRELLSWGHIPKSRYSMITDAWKHRVGFNTLTGMVRQIVLCARRRGRGLAYAYWPEYDSCCHSDGCYHHKTITHLEEIDRALGKLVMHLKGTDTVLVVTADHGLVDALPPNCIELRDVPGFYDCLAVVPSGDARAVQCFVRPARVKEFLSLVRKRLSKFCICVSGEYLLESRMFGLGKPHASLANRVGDYVLLARPGCAFSSSLPGMESSFNVGNHGGMSETEMLVPLYVVRS